MFRVRILAWLWLLLLHGIPAPAETNGTAGPAQPMAAPGIENFFRVTDRLYSGGEPTGDDSFLALQRLGIRTILSVDGTRPDLDRAVRYGLRYIHLPHGYDGISSNTILRLIVAARTAEGPIFVHCHHGKHRGAAAVGVICQATAGWTPTQAAAWLHQAGTSPDYPGLHRVNATFQMPAAQVLAAVPTNFPPRAEVSDVVEAMVEMDRRWDHLRELQGNGWAPLAQHPDLVPAREALLLKEAIHELDRANVAPRYRGDFAKILGRAVADSTELEKLLTPRPSPEPALRAQAEALMKSIGTSCADCHRRSRN